MQVNLGEIGIDKMTLKNISPVIGDIEKLRSHNNVSFKTGKCQRSYYIDGGIIELGEIEIRDAHFYLRMGSKRKGSMLIDYERLEFNPAYIMHGSNLSNINKKEDLNLVLKVLNIKLNEYGIEANIRNAKISTIEINTNISLKNSFVEYKQCFEFISKSLKLKSSVEKEYDELNSYTGFKAQNKEVALKFYDKTKEMNIDGGNSILRVEYTFKNSNKIKKALGYDIVDDLINNIESLGDKYNNYVYRHIIKPVKDKINNLVKVNLKSLLKIREQERYYIKVFCSRTQDDTIFDFDIVCAAIKKMKLSKSSVSERCKSLYEELAARELSGEKNFFGNLENLNEIIIGLGFEKVVL